MIKSLQIKNIQSHKDSELEFSPGINCIVGTSNNGKSAVLRALYWAINNRPLGIDVLCSHWALNDKNKQIEEMSVTVENDAGVLTRRKSSTTNEYEVNGTKLEAVRTDVPEDVEQFFNIKEINFQRQLDAPFLLSLSSGEIAKFFNKIIRLDVIDRVLTSAEQKRRKLKSSIEQCEEDIQNYKERIEKFDWLENVEKLLKKYENVESYNSEIESRFNSIKESVEAYKKLKVEDEKYSKVIEGKKVIENIENEISKIAVVENKIDSLKKSITSYKEISEEKEKYEFGNVEKIIEKIFEVHNSNSKIENEIEVLRNSISRFKKLKEETGVLVTNIKVAKSKLPKVCPLCGNPMNNEV